MRRGINSTMAKCVLIVDDQPKIVSFMELKLKLCGFDVISAASGKEALEKVQACNPDVMLLDVVMPEMDGFEALRRLRAYSTMPVIAFSASPAYADRAIGLGANSFVVKPFDADDVVARINSLLNRD